MVKRNYSTFVPALMSTLLFLFSAAANAEPPRHHRWEGRIEKARHAAYDVERDSRHLGMELGRVRAETFPGHATLRNILERLKERAKEVSGKADELVNVIRRDPAGNWEGHLEATRDSFSQLQRSYQELEEHFDRFFHEIAEHEGPRRHPELHNVKETFNQLKAAMSELQFELPDHLK